MIDPDDDAPSVEYRTPFVLGKPIKNPADFYGRGQVLRELFDAVLNAQLVSVVGEHRCGNTSMIYQMIHPDVRGRYLTPEQDGGLVYALIHAQLAADSVDALFRRIGRTLRRADPDAKVDFTASIDRRWLEDYLEDLADRRKRLVLLMDEFEVLADFRHGFWEWFEGLVNEYDVSIVATSRTDLGEFRTTRGSGPPFFNMFRSVYIGSFQPATVDEFFRAKSEITDFDFSGVRDTIAHLAGRFPYYMQVASALFYVHAGGQAQVSPETIETIQHEFTARTVALFDDAWHKLPQDERDALTWIVLGGVPEGADEQTHHQAVQSLERRGYFIDGRVFSVALTEFVRDHLTRVSLNPRTGKVRVERRVIDLPPKQTALLAFLLDHEGKVVSRDDLARVGWPEQSPGALPDATIHEAIRQLREAIEPVDGSVALIERVGDAEYRLVNAKLA
jgi:hypothetical protein